MSLELDCGKCHRRFAVDSTDGPQQVLCPSCGNAVAVPSALRADTSVSADRMFCSKCGQENRENNFKCTRCGFVLHGRPAPQYIVTDDNTMGGLIPYKNAQALWAYYLGLFSLIPVLGIALGIAAVVLGIKGLRNAEVHPEVRGKIHAWVGIVMGGLFAFLYSAAMLMILFKLK